MAPAPEEKMATVCQELDLLTLRLMDQLELLRNKRTSLNQLIEKGWLSLSQSRYSMGNKFVSSLQYKQDMAPSVVVLESCAPDGNTSFEVERASPTALMATKSVDHRAVEEIGATEPKLRHRKGPAETIQPTTTEPRGPGPAPAQDPLHWFGILVPQSLRQAQTTFREGIQLAAEVASLQSSVDCIQRRYGTLMAQKRKLQAS
ncbi:coiled-coil domain-containing protein 115 [Pelobates fuscus]|uniref:coiled-coil domain-containing protein 115 n=1 Tax=Pelobates fuscus TaxID=191477 RepID=UPI002FE43DE0